MALNCTRNQSKTSDLATKTDTDTARAIATDEDAVDALPTPSQIAIYDT